MSDRICLVVPCFNEKSRLAVDTFKNAASEDLHFLFVDDGSRDGTANYLRTQFEGISSIHVFALQKNAGKAEAVRRGMLELLATGKLNNYAWVGFWDADLATPLSELADMRRYHQHFYPTAIAVWGSRVYRLGSKIVRSPIRHYFGRFFATAIAWLLGVESYDSQCGAKIFLSSSIGTAFREPFISRWIFDVEILLRLRDFEIVEYPLKCWKDVPGSKFKIGREALRVFWAILAIRKKYLKK